MLMTYPPAPFPFKGRGVEKGEGAISTLASALLWSIYISLS